MLFCRTFPESRGHDVLANSPPVECLDFERPPLYLSELHIAGAMAFASSALFDGFTLIEWVDSMELFPTGATGIPL